VFWLLLLAIWSALNAIVLGNDLFNLYVALELLTFAAVPLVCLKGTPETIAARIKRALPYVKKEDVILAPDCGMKYLPRDVAFGKMKAMVDAAKILRHELG